MATRKPRIKYFVESLVHIQVKGDTTPSNLPQMRLGGEFISKYHDYLTAQNMYGRFGSLGSEFYSAFHSPEDAPKIEAWLIENGARSERPTLKKDTQATLDELNTKVTSAIVVQEAASREVSRLEEEIAKLTDPTSVEGQIARRGAVSAALQGRDEQRAQNLVDQYVGEAGTTLDFCMQLHSILNSD